MPQFISIDSIHENIFLLLNVAYASGEFAKKHDIFCDESEEQINRNYYFGWLRVLLSEKLIESAAKTRLLMDLVLKEEGYYREEGETYSVDVRRIDREICRSCQIGTFMEGSGKLTLREACNKIIHATDLQPEIVDLADSPPSRVWTGHLFLYGQKGRQTWIVNLSVVNFCLGLEELLSRLENEVDWHHMYKYDDVF